MKNTNLKIGTWIRCGFDSLSEPIAQNSSYIGNQGNFGDSIIVSKGKRRDSFISNNYSPTSVKSMQFAYSFDVKFINEDHYEGTAVKMVQTKLYKVKNYFWSWVDSNLASATAKVDQIKILQIESMNYKLDLVKKGGNRILSDYTPDGYRKHICQLEFISTIENKDKIVTRYDSKAKLWIVALNSIHILYCQCYFYSTDTGMGYHVKLFDLVKPNDHPSFDIQGKTSLWIDDMQWSPTDMFCIIALKSRDIAIISRLGQLLKFVTYPSYDIKASMKFNLEKFRSTPTRFNELVYSRDAQNIAWNQRNFLDEITLDSNNHQEKLKIILNENFFVIKDNRVVFVYEYSHHEDILPFLSWSEKSNLNSKLGFDFLRLCLSHDVCCTIPDNLERIPVLMNSKLPQFEFEKNVEIDEIDDDVPVIKTTSQIQPFELNKSQMSAESFNQEFKLEPEILLSNFSKFLMSLRWTKSHPKNFKEWFLSIVDDWFYFYLKMNEPVYAYHLLKISKSFIQKFLFVLDKESKKEDKNTSDAQLEPENHTIKEWLSFISECNSFSDSNYRTYSVGSKFEHQEWQIKEFDNENITLEGNKYIGFHKNYALLVFYGLIQFRNYQANNFNILFLAFSWNILRKHYTPLGAKHISKIVDLVFKNYDLKDKSDEYEMFLGKCGKN